MQDSPASDAVEVVPEASTDPKVLMTCEHASQRLPPPWSWPAADRRLVDTHWAYDIGAADVTRSLCERLGAGAVLARFSRLLIDPNRMLEAETLFRKRCDGEPVLLNADLSEEEKQRRIEALWQPYHEQIDAIASQTSASVLFSVHSFTDRYEGKPRAVELGVLFDEAEELAATLQQALQGAGWDTRLNEPYSGRDGYAYSAEVHAKRHGKRALELEVRQDLIVRPDFRARLVEVLAAAFASF